MKRQSAIALLLLLVGFVSIAPVALADPKKPQAVTSSTERREPPISEATTQVLEEAKEKDKEKEKKDTPLTIWASIAQILATLGVLLGIFTYFRQRKAEYEQGVITRYRECTSQILGYYNDCKEFTHRDHVFDIAGILGSELSEAEYKRAIRFQILLTHLEESHLLYEHPENHMQLMSCRVWTETLFLWMRNKDFQDAAMINRGFMSPAYSRSIDLFIAMHRAYEAGRMKSPFKEDEGKNLPKYTCDPRLTSYLGQGENLAVIAKIGKAYANRMGFPKYKLPKLMMNSKGMIEFSDGSHLMKSENPVQFAILSYLLDGNEDAFKDFKTEAEFWKTAAEELRCLVEAHSKVTFHEDELYRPLVKR